MDRRQQRGLILAVVAAFWSSLAAAQEPSPSVSPSPTVRPTPAATATPRPSPTERKPAPAVTPAPRPVELPKPPAPAGGAVDEAAARRNAERRARRQEIERFLDGKDGDGPLTKMLERLPPGEDREAFRRNLTRWRDLPPQERDALRGQVDNRGERIREETDNAIRESGLNLNPDQREVFALRYRQERRKLEQALLAQMNAERNRRLPKIVEQLKKEFPAPPVATPAPSPTAKPTTVPPATATPSPTPSVG